MIPSFSQYTGDLSETPLIQVPRHCSIKTLKLNPQTQGGTGREFPRRLCDPLLLPLSPPVHLPSPILIGSHPPVPHHITLRYWELLLKLGKKVFIHKPVTNVLYPKCSGFLLLLLLTVQGYELFRTRPSKFYCQLQFHNIFHRLMFQPLVLLMVGKWFINQIGTYRIKRAFYHQLLEVCLQFSPQ